ncbi:MULTISPECIES: carbohydrate ABC transporter permease [Paenibacillus]|uniref:Lactose ABC transporter permease n=1 Tax=Paenibacillus albilobatus TaxID=2716884 RepID=A0A919XNL4_9BACL|nr:MULTISPECIES: sugar ABC transporter permease [Paenibacillus]GIO34095.1 lactose ABC transporter permease [Paenibacillus albilobatus]
MKKKLTLSQKKSLLGVLFISPWFLGFVFLFAVPLYESLVYSFNHLTVAMSGFDTEFAGLQFYKEIFYKHPTFNRVLLDAVADLLINIPSIVVFSLFAATLLNQKFRGRVLARAIFFLPVLLATNLLSIEQSSNLAEVAQTVTGGGDAGLKSSELEALLLQSGFGSGLTMYITGSVNRIYEIISHSGVQILIFLAGLQSVPPALYEAAKIEGTTGYEAFWKITFPMVSPLILTNIVYTVIDSYNYNKLSVLINDTAFKALNFSLSAAMSWAYFAVASIILLILVRLVSRKVFYFD